MELERAVYNLKGDIVGYMLYYQDVKDKSNKEKFKGFKRVV